MTRPAYCLLPSASALMPVFVPALVSALFSASLVGCSSRAVDTGASARATGLAVAATGTPSHGPAAARPATAAASGATALGTTSPSRATSAAGRPVRPIPEVISRAKRFRVADAEASSAATLLASAALDASAAARAGSAAGHSGRPHEPFAPRRIDHEVDGQAPDVAGIGSMMRSYLQAFNRHDATALAAHWSPTGENVDLDSGEATSGREAVREVFTTLFEQDAAATIDIDVTSIRPLRDDVAVVDGVSRITFTDGAPSSSRFSAVVVRQAGTWMLDTVRESSVPLQAASARPLDELAWLLGAWEDVSDGVTASTQCFWSANKAFLIRSHLLTAGPATPPRPLAGDDQIPGLLAAGSAGSREITEIIGWDPDRRQLRSWVFTSDGGFAEGSWSHDGDTWTVRLDGGPAGECLYTLTRRGADELSCQCRSDGLADIMPPACDFTRTARAGDALGR